ncbi:MAG: hypothetical protein ACK5LC_09945 [Coprobacillaceae bacterium]
MKKHGKTKPYIKRGCILESRMITKPDFEILSRIYFAIGCTLDAIMYYKKAES